MKKIILVLASAISGFILFNKLSLISFFLFAYFVLNPSRGFWADPSGVFYGVILLLGTLIGSIAMAVIFGLVSLGKFNSPNWRINRYYFIFLPTIIILICSYVIFPGGNWLW
jgi:hypothetical protein